MTKDLEGILAPAEQAARQMRLGDADEGLGSASARHSFRFLHPEARIDQHRHGADFEEGEGQGEEIGAGCDHQHGAYATADAVGFQGMSDAVTELIEFAEAQPAVLRGKMMAAYRAGVGPFQEDGRRC